MRRRGFLRLFGAALAAPALPALPAATAAPVSYPRIQYGMAVFHARTRAHVTVRGLAAKLGVTPAQAQAMMAEMTARGVITPVSGAPGAMRAVSNILKTDPWPIRRTSAQAGEAKANRSSARHHHRPATWLTHLHDLCETAGIPLSPRARALSAA